MVTRINESNIKKTYHVNVNVSKSDGKKCNSNQKRNNVKCRCGSKSLRKRMQQKLYLESQYIYL